MAQKPNIRKKANFARNLSYFGAGFNKETLQNEKKVVFFS